MGNTASAIKTHDYEKITNFLCSDEPKGKKSIELDKSDKPINPPPPSPVHTELSSYCLFRKKVNFIRSYLDEHIYYLPNKWIPTHSNNVKIRNVPMLLKLILSVRQYPKLVDDIKSYLDNDKTAVYDLFEGSTMLMWAVQQSGTCSSLEVVKILVEHGGADINYIRAPMEFNNTISNCMTAIEFSFQPSADLAVTSYLIDKDCGLCHQNTSCNSAILLLSGLADLSRSHLNNIFKLKQKNNSTEANIYLDKLFDVLDLLLKKGISIYSYDKKTKISLLMRILEIKTNKNDRKLDLIKYMRNTNETEKKPKVIQRDSNGISIWEYMVGSMNFNWEIVFELLENGVNFGRCEKSKKNNFIMEIFENNYGIGDKSRTSFTQLFEKYNFDINYKNANGDTLLILCIKNKHNFKTFKYFVDRGADINVLDKDGINLLVHALNNLNDDNLQISIYLMENGLKITSTIRFTNKHILYVLTKCSYDINRQLVNDVIKSGCEIPDDLCNKILLLQNIDKKE